MPLIPDRQYRQKKRGEAYEKTKNPTILRYRSVCDSRVLMILSITGTVTYAAGLVDNTVSDSNAYSNNSLENYQLDFYVDSSWDWLPWNWLDGIGKVFSTDYMPSQTLSGR